MFSDVDPQKVIYRDGMCDYIQNSLQEEVLQKLERLDRDLLFEVELNKDLTTAAIGERIWKAKDVQEAEFQSAQDIQKDPRTKEQLEDSPGTSNENGDVQSSSSQPNIIAVLYLGPEELCRDWEFKPISIKSQKNAAVLFNLRRLFSSTAESFISRLAPSGSAVAIELASGSCRVLQRMLRLAFYVEGEYNKTSKDLGGKTPQYGRQ